MSLFAFTTDKRPDLAAKEIKEAGFKAFCLMMPERRATYRYKAKSQQAIARKWKPEPRPAMFYVFVEDPDPWSMSKMKHVRQAVRFCGRWQPIPEKQAAWLRNPPRPLFHDADIPRFKNAAVNPPPVVKAGDMVRFTLACEEHTRPVQSVDGETLLLEIRILSRDVKVRVPASMVEVAA